MLYTLPRKGVMLGPLGILFIILGLLSLYRPTLEWLIRLNNTMRGVETRVTKGTVFTYRLIGVILILFGLLITFGMLTP